MVIVPPVRRMGLGCVGISNVSPLCPFPRWIRDPDAEGVAFDSSPAEQGEHSEEEMEQLFLDSLSDYPGGGVELPSLRRMVRRAWLRLRGRREFVERKETLLREKCEDDLGSGGGTEEELEDEYRKALAEEARKHAELVQRREDDFAHMHL